MRPNQYEYDAFISHAVEDKIPIANELCAKLERAGLKVWYSGKELGVGDSIEKTIQKGLNRSRYGIVIFSPTYLAKNWTIREFYTLLSKEIEEHKVILPVLYNVTLDDLKNKDLVMADRFAVNADKGIDFVVERLVGEIRKSYAMKTEQTWFAKLWFLLVISLLANVGLLFKDTFQDRPAALTQANQLYNEQERASFAHPVSQKSFFGEIKGLFDQMSHCHCQLAEDGASPPRQVYSAGFDGQHEHGSMTARHRQYQHEDKTEKARSGAGKKLTMALVFQMETLGETPAYAYLEHEVDEIIDDITLNAESEPFLTVTNLPEEGNSLTGSRPRASCLTH